jgi:hypothetical protein
MNTKLIMISSAVLMALIGIALSFFPGEIAVFIGVGFAQTFQLILQLSGALYFAFAMLNWMAKGSHIGGIYNRPIAIANFTHFLMGGLALIKIIMNNPGITPAIWILAGLYSLFAVLFGWILMRNPVSEKNLTSVKA